MPNQTNSNLIADAVFEGGGVKGIGLVGAALLPRKKGTTGQIWRVPPPEPLWLHY